MNHLNQMIALIGECANCPLAEGRNRIVYGSGVEHPDLVLVGEAPGRSEDEGGEPFIGRSGKMLTTVLAELGFTRESNLYITNTCRCRPPENRTPKVKEVRACVPYLQEELQMLKPKVIVTLGLTPAKALISKDFKMGEQHGQFFDTPYGKVMATYHPAAVLRTPLLKEVFLADLAQLKEFATQTV